MNPKEDGIDLLALPRIDDYRAIGRILSKIELGDLKFNQTVATEPKSEVGKKLVVGVTGGSGVGKSTFINSLIGVALADNKKIAVLAIDPMSKIDRGTFLGDRLRFDHSYPEKGVFIRSVSSSGAEHDVPESLASMLLFLGMIGYNFLIVESIGIGQSDAEIKRHTDKLIFIPSPDLEDWVQALKNEALINANVVFVNNRGGSRQHQLLATVSQVIEIRNSKHEITMLISGNAKEGSGIKELYNSMTQLESR